MTAACAGDAGYEHEYGRGMCTVVVTHLALARSFPVGILTHVNTTKVGLDYIVIATLDYTPA